MDYHQHARLTVYSRELLAKQVMEQGVMLKLAAASFNVSTKTAAKWVRRYREQGLTGLGNRSSRPHRLRQPTSSEVAARVQALRRERWSGHRIAMATGLSRATVSRVLRRAKLSRGAIWSRVRSCSVTSTPLPAICCISTSSAWCASRGPATG